MLKLVWRPCGKLLDRGRAWDFQGQSEQHVLNLSSHVYCRPICWRYTSELHRPCPVLGYHALLCTLASILVATLSGWSVVGFLYVLFFFESTCYPVSPIYSLSTLLIRLSCYQFSFLFSKKKSRGSKQHAMTRGLVQARMQSKITSRVARCLYLFCFTMRIVMEQIRCRIKP